MTLRHSGALSAGITSAGTHRASRWPARLDVAQSLTGLVLALFVGVHLFLDASILIGPAAADFIARLFEGQPFLDTPQPWFVSVFALGILALVVAHALLAVRKLPHDYRELAAFRRHNAGLRHADTRLWWWQAVTGFALFFLVAVHVYMPITVPEAIGATPSARRIVAENAWALYVVLLPVVVLHAALGVYRLALKWGWPPAAATEAGRHRLQLAAYAVTAFYVLLGLAALVTYVRLGLSLGAHP
ncbi:MAG: fumarate reductase cytochrome b subunit [Gammaproteobacteria bacterium]|jgi:fumarate reductase subunit C|nr:fumarate reductase cytochrome b subunit [Gammaproteobacteria bacterium]